MRNDVNGFLSCRACHRSYRFYGSADPTTWPTHRCGRLVGTFDEFGTDDPNFVPIDLKGL